MPSVKTRLERLEAARGVSVRCVWLYVGWKGHGGFTAGGDEGVYRVFVPVRPEALAPGLLVVLRHPDPVGAEVSAAAAAWVLKQLALGPGPRFLTTRARILVLVTAGGPAPPPEAAAADVAPPAAEIEPPPAAERPPPTAEGPPPPAAAPPPPAPPPWPEWLPR
ncbi:MAG: hypothetical protein JO284_10285 [Planctomycetaceae bacterium]|nr:hypothetical protein [Planctomycetaceae bacterium]